MTKFSGGGMLFFISTFALTLLLIPLIIKICNAKKIYDFHDERKVHQGDIPRLGGIGIFISFYIFFCLGELNNTKTMFSRESIVFLACSFSLFVACAIDDLFNMKWQIKLLIQLLCAIIPVIFGFSISVSNDMQTSIIIKILSFTWILGVTNAFNLIDGIDGLCGGLGLIAISASAFVMNFIFGYYQAVFIALLLASCILAFLTYNFPLPKAKIFLGDSGSQTIGYIISLLPLFPHPNPKINISYSFFIIFIIFSLIPIYDCIASILRRLRMGVSIFYPDKFHLHHKFMNFGFSNLETLLTLLFISLSLCATSILFLSIWTHYFLTYSLCMLLIMLEFFTIVHYKNLKFETKDML